MEDFGERGNPQGRSKLEENVAQLEASCGPDGHVGLVGQTEGRENFSTPSGFPGKNQPGIFERVEASLGTSRKQIAPSQLEENLRKLGQEFGPEHAVIVGKTEGREFVPPSANSVDSEAPRKPNENVEMSEN